MKFVRQGFQKLEPKPDRQTHTQIDMTENTITAHLQVVTAMDLYIL